MDASGSFSYVFRLPEDVGRDVVVIEVRDSSGKYADVRFEVLSPPRLLSFPPSGPPGTEFRVRGENFTKGGVILVGGITIDGQPFNTSAIILDIRSFVFDFRPGNGLSPASFVIRATDSAGLTATMTLSVSGTPLPTQSPTPSPSPTVTPTVTPSATPLPTQTPTATPTPTRTPTPSPTPTPAPQVEPSVRYGVVGTRLTITVRNFTPNGRIFPAGATFGGLQITGDITQLNSQGVGAIGVEVPFSLSRGVKEIRVTDTAGLTASTRFSVDPALGIGNRAGDPPGTPLSEVGAYPGDTIEMEGQAFIPGSQIIRLPFGILPSPAIFVGADGKFTGIVVVPNVAPGVYLEFVQSSDGVVATRNIYARPQAPTLTPTATPTATVLPTPTAIPTPTPTPAPSSTPTPPATPTPLPTPTSTPVPVPTPTPTPAPTPVPTPSSPAVLFVSPRTDRIFTTRTLTGDFFTPNSTIPVGALVCAGVGLNMSPVGIDGSGVFEFTFQVPIPGVSNMLSYACSAVDATGRTASIQQPLVIELSPSISLNLVRSGGPQNRTATGTGWLPGSTILSVELRCNTVSGLKTGILASNVAIIGSGAFSFDYSWPYALVQGDTCTVDVNNPVNNTNYNFSVPISG